MRCDPVLGSGEGLSFGGGHPGRSAEVGAGGGFRVQTRGVIESRLQFVHRQAHHEHVERAATEHAIAPQEGQQILRDDEMRVLGVQLARIMAGEAFVPGQQGALSFRSLLAQASGGPRAPQREQGRTARCSEWRGIPRVIRLAPALAIERTEQEIGGRFELRKVRRPFRPPFIYEPCRAPGVLIRIGLEMAEARGHSATGATARLRCGRDRRPAASRRRRARGNRLGAADAHGESRAAEAHFETPGKGCAQAEVHVVPKNRRIAPDRRKIADTRMAVRVALDDFQARFERRVVDGAPELAQPATERRDEAAFAQFAPYCKTPALRGASQLPPKTPDEIGGDFRAAQERRGDAQILDLAKLEPLLGRHIGLKPDVAGLCAGDRARAPGSHRADAAAARRPRDPATPAALESTPPSGQKAGPRDARAGLRAGGRRMGRQVADSWFLLL